MPEPRVFFCFFSFAGSKEKKIQSSGVLETDFFIKNARFLKKSSFFLQIFQYFFIKNPCSELLFLTFSGTTKLRGFEGFKIKIPFNFNFLEKSVFIVKILKSKSMIRRDA